MLATFDFNQRLPTPLLRHRPRGSAAPSPNRTNGLLERIETKVDRLETTVDAAGNDRDAGAERRWTGRCSLARTRGARSILARPVFRPRQSPDEPSLQL